LKNAKHSIRVSNVPFGLGFLLATFFLVFGTLFGRKKVALLNPLTNGKITNKSVEKLLHSHGHSVQTLKKNISIRNFVKRVENLSTAFMVC
jgi:hypothetical protein